MGWYISLSRQGLCTSRVVCWVGYSSIVGMVIGYRVCGWVGTVVSRNGV